MRTELECVVLALVGLRQPCVTAYAVRREFDRSLSAHWSSSAGSIYPLLQRLTRAGLLATTPAKPAKRNAQWLRLTAAGARVVRRWLSAKSTAAELIGHDPLRTRFRFLDRLARPDALRTVDDAERALREALEQIRQDQPEDLLDRLSHRNVELTLRARLVWLAEVREALSNNKRTRSPAETANRAAGETSRVNRSRRALRDRAAT